MREEYHKHMGPHTTDGVYHDPDCEICKEFVRKKTKPHFFFSEPNPKEVCFGSGHNVAKNWYEYEQGNWCPICFSMVTGDENTIVPIHKHPQGTISSPQPYRQWVNHETGEIQYQDRKDYEWNSID